jgi:transposase
MSKTFRPFDIDQPLLLPPDIRDWLPEEHLARFVLEVVPELDLSSILADYQKGDGRGRPPYHPRMMVGLLLYAYCMGIPSSRKIEAATYTDVAFRVLAGNQHPDHDSIATFRKRHLSWLSSLFVQVLQLCERAGLVSLGHVAFDGTKVLANASKHKAMSYARMCQAQQTLEAEVAALLEQAEQVDAAEDEQFGKSCRGDELPAELARRESRLHKIREAKASLEQEAREKAEQKAEAARKKIEERKRQEEQTGKKAKGPTPKVPDPEVATPEAKAQRNFTDPESRIMKDAATKSFVQAYNGQAAVDGQAQIITAAEVTQEANDKQQLAGMLVCVKENTGRFPEKASADSGFFSTMQLSDERIAGVDLYVTPDKEAALVPKEAEGEEACSEASLVAQMRAKLASEAGRAVYKMRKAIVEPVFGQIKEVRGFRRFSFRGLFAVSCEWKLICLTHNLLKLFGSGGLAQSLVGAPEPGSGVGQGAFSGLLLPACPLLSPILRLFWQWVVSVRAILRLPRPAQHPGFVC